MSNNDHQKPNGSHVASSGILAGSNSFMAIASMVMIVGFVGYTISDVERAGTFFSGINGFITTSLDWFYIGTVCAVLVSVMWLPFSRFGDIKLGKDEDTPDFSTWSWVSMLFSAGLGSGLLYWGVAEPLYHVQGNPYLEAAGVEPNTAEAAVIAVRITLFHWGFHGWGLYVLVGLCLAYFAYRNDLPLTLRTALYPVLKERIFGVWGHIVDLVGVFGTIFGLATSLGMGVLAINAGLESLFGFTNSVGNQLILIGAITIMGTTSAVTGVEKGVRILSEANVIASIVLMVVFLIFGPTAFILGIMVTVTGDYLWNVIPMGFLIDGDPESQWQSWWTVFYWGWWIAWCPFVGLFIARISRGRTIREFVTFVLLMPTAVLILWLAVFGGGSIGMELFNQIGLIDVVNDDYSNAIYAALTGLNLGWFTSVLTVLTTILLISWFVTSSDSGTLVICTMLSMGDEHPPIKFRLFWGLLSGVVAGVLLLAGGLQALQTASIVAALPLAIICLLMVYGITKALREDHPLPDFADRREKVYLNR
ncbi:MAG: BCCT family transporter [Acidiferrobacterales bacterium]|nr:BCCT family transporter [Acidiferrobacterales bacterium]